MQLFIVDSLFKECWMEQNLHIFEFIHKIKYFRGEAMTRLGSSLKECLVSVEKTD